MKLICKNTPNDIRDVMFDTNYATIEVKEYKDGEYMLRSDKIGLIYTGTRLSVQNLWNKIITAEKRGDKFFEISN